MNRLAEKWQSAAGKQGADKNFNATICSCHKDAENREQESHENHENRLAQSWEKGEERQGDSAREKLQLGKRGGSKSCRQLADSSE